MPTLFRAADPLSAHPPGGQVPIRAPTSLSQAPPGVVQAELLPSGTSLPVGHVIELPAARKESGRLATPRYEQSAVPAQPSQTGAVRAPDTQPPSAARAETEVVADDGAWRRLQAIFRKHKVKQGTEQSSTPIQREPTGQPVPGATRTTPAPEVRRKTSSRPTMPVGVDRAPAPDPPAEGPGQEPEAGQPPAEPELPSSAVAEDGPPEAEAVEEAGMEALMGSTDPEAEGAGELIVEPATIVTEASATMPEVKARDQTLPGATAELQAGTKGPPPHVSDRPAVQEREPNGHDRSEDETSLSESAQHSLPLQSVWSVQRLGEASTSATEAAVDNRAASDPPSPPESPSSMGAGAIQESVEVPATEPLHRTLIGATPGRPSDSSIELIHPRRPRPEVPPPRTSRQDREPDQGPVEERWPERHEELPSGPRQAETPVSVAPSEGVPDEFVKEQIPVRLARGLSPPKNDAQRVSTLQMRRGEGLELAQARPPNEVPGRSELVETDIGPLPADLWHLIGESPPKEPGPDVSTSRSGATGSGHDAEVKGAVVAAEAQPTPPAPPTLEKPATHSGPTASIQRIPGEAEALPEVGGAEAEAGAISNESGAAEDPDMDELTRRVYAEIKRRFSVEWERVRQRG
jgi:hypothetical protein